jgi:hypothetical protein
VEWLNRIKIFSLAPPRVATFIDELPEVLRIGQCFVFSDGEFQAEKEVVKGPAVKDAVDDDLLVDGLEIEAPFLSAKSVKGFAIPLDLSKALVLKMLQVISRHLEFIEELELFEGVELGDFSRTDFVEDDL